MTKEKNIDAGKKPQDKFADERLTDDEFDKVAGGTGNAGENFSFKEDSSSTNTTYETMGK